MSFARTLKDKTKSIWEDCYKHPFLHELGTGTLNKEIFKFYLLQDYKYLIEYAKIFALGVVKAHDEKLMTNFTISQYNILYKEMELHRSYMKDFGITSDEADAAKLSLFGRAYTQNMLAMAQSGGIAEIIAVVFPCAWTYYDYAKRLKEDYKDFYTENYYKSWIDSYSCDEFGESFEWFYDALDKTCEYKSPQELKDIEDIFKSSVEFEYLFWDMAYNRQMSYKVLNTLGAVDKMVSTL